MTTVLVVDDDANLVDLLCGYLEREGYTVSAASDGPSAVAAARERRPDLVVLDLMLPGFDGLEVCRRHPPIQRRVCADAHRASEEIDRIVGLEVGADDYLGKPFSPRELVARVKAMLRRPRGAIGEAERAPPVIRVGDLVIDESRHQLRCAEQRCNSRRASLLC